MCVSQGRLVGQIRVGGNSMRVGGTMENTLKEGGREGRGNKDFKKEGKLDQGVGALKRGGGWKPLTNYGSICYILGYR